MYDAKLDRQPPIQAKGDSDHNTLYVKVRFGARIAPNRRVMTAKITRHFDGQKLKSDGDSRERVVNRFVANLPEQPTQPNTISEMAGSFTKTLLDAVEAEVPPPPRRSPKIGWCESAETLAVFNEARDASDKARRCLCTNPRERTAWKTLKTTYANLRKVIDPGAHRCFVECVVEAERLLADNDQIGVSICTWKARSV